MIKRYIQLKAHENNKEYRSTVNQDDISREERIASLGTTLQEKPPKIPSKTLFSNSTKKANIKNLIDQQNLTQQAFDHQTSMQSLTNQSLMEIKQFSKEKKSTFKQHLFIQSS